MLGILPPLQRSPSFFVAGLTSEERFVMFGSGYTDPPVCHKGILFRRLKASTRTDSCMKSSGKRPPCKASGHSVKLAQTSCEWMQIQLYQIVYISFG